MPVYSSEALILRTYKLGEADRIVVFLTKDRGKKRGVAKNARKSQKRFLGALEPMTCGHVAYYEREQRELVRLNYVDTIHSPLSTSDGGALGHVGYFAELIDECAPDADPNERLFRLGAAVMEALTKGTPVGRLARYFEYWLLRLQGVYPSLTHCAVCNGGLESGGAAIGERDHVYVCPACAANQASLVSPEALAFLRVAAALPPHRVGEVPLSAKAGRQLEIAHRRLIANHLEKELRSARVLRQLS